MIEPVVISSIGDIIHFLTIALTVAIPSLGVGIGEGLASKTAIASINIAPKAANDIVRVAILGTALIETAAIIGVTIAGYLLFGSTPADPFYGHIAELGIAAAICLSGFTIGLASSFATQEACKAIARQPFFADKIVRFMLITQSIIQTPILFSFIVALFIYSRAAQATSLPASLMLIAAGLCIGLGSIGPALGLGTFAKYACRAIGMNRHAYGSIFSFTIISQAIIETPIIFALVTALMLILFPAQSTILSGIAFLSAALCMGLGTLGSGLASGHTASRACKQIALRPDSYGALSRTSMFAQGLIDTCAIYTFLIATLLILIS